MVLPLIDFNCQNLREFIYKLSEHVTVVNDVVLDVGVGSCVFLNFKLPPDKMSTLPFFKCALIL